MEVSARKLMETNSPIHCNYFFTSTLPITVRVFSVSLPDVSLLVFPVVGILLIVFFLWFCLSESIRINSIDNKIKLIIRDCFPHEYVKETLVPLTNRKKGVLPIFRWRMAIWVPISLSIHATCNCFKYDILSYFK